MSKVSITCNASKPCNYLMVFTFFAFLLSTAGLSSTALAQQDKALKLVTGDAFPPYADQKLSGGGLSLQIIKAIYKQAGRNVEIETYPWKCGYLMVEKMMADATFPYSDSGKRRLTMLYSNPLHTGVAGWMTRRGEQVASPSAKNLEGKVVCTGVGYRVPKSVTDAKAEDKIELIRVTELPQCLEMMNKNRVDIVEGSEYQLKYMYSQTKVPSDRLVFTGYDQLGTTSLHLIVSKDHPRGEKIISEFNAALSEVKRNGSYQKLVDDFFK